MKTLKIINLLKNHKMMNHQNLQIVSQNNLYLAKMKQVFQADYLEILIILKNPLHYLKILKKGVVYLVILVEVYLEILVKIIIQLLEGYLAEDYSIFRKLIKKKKMMIMEKRGVRKKIILVNQIVQNMNIILKMILMIKNQIKMDILKDILKRLIMLYYMIN